VTSTINSDKLELIECNGVTSFVLSMLSVRLGEPLVPMVGLGWVGLGAQESQRVRGERRMCWSIDTKSNLSITLLLNTYTHTHTHTHTHTQIVHK
jgi:hypothetical protein